jgi:hypothetical protein
MIEDRFTDMVKIRETVTLTSISNVLMKFQGGYERVLGFGLVSFHLTLTITITLTLTLTLTLMLNPNRNEIRVGTRGFQVSAEAYEIKAVSLSANGSEEGGNEGNPNLHASPFLTLTVTLTLALTFILTPTLPSNLTLILTVAFGDMRVGDYAEQKLSLGNKGKYKIGFKFVFSRPGMSKYLTISPMEGEIEPGGKDFGSISLTFCSQSDAIELVGNKHIIVQVRL